MWDLLTYINFAFCVGVFLYIHYLFSYRRLAVQNALSTTLPFFTPHQTYLFSIGFFLWAFALLVESVQSYTVAFYPELLSPRLAYTVFITHSALLTASILYLGDALVHIVYIHHENRTKLWIDRLSSCRQMGIGVLLLIWFYTSTFSQMGKVDAVYWINIYRMYLGWQWVIIVTLLLIYRKRSHPLKSEIFILLCVWLFAAPLELAGCASRKAAGEIFFFGWDASASGGAGKAALLTSMRLFLFALILIRSHFYFSRITFRQAKALKDEKQIMISFLHKLNSRISEIDNTLLPSGPLSHEESIQFYQEPNLDKIFRTALEFGMDLCGASAGAAFVREDIQQMIASTKYDQNKGMFLVPRIIEGMYPPKFEVSHLSDDELQHPETQNQFLRTEKILYGKGVVGDVAKKGVSERVIDPQSDSRVVQLDDKRLTIHSMLVVPVRVYERTFGVLSLINKDDGLTPFTEEDESLLCMVAEQTSIVLRNIIIHHQLQETKRFELEMELAREVHQTLLPSQSPVIPGYDISSTSYSAQEVGGDYYDFLPLDERTVAIVIADVSGKGIPGALTMATVRSALRSLASVEKTPVEMMIELNQILVPDLRAGTFVSMMLALLDIPSGRMRIARAGHDPLLHFSKDSDDYKSYMPAGMILGVVDGDIYNNAMVEITVDLEPGDMAVFFTDGITETMNNSMQQYTLDRFVKVLAEHKHQEAQVVLHCVYESLDHYACGYPQHDDQTLIILKRLS
jgi:phosphoserine phosphatase RsbU/P